MYFFPEDPANCEDSAEMDSTNESEVEVVTPLSKVKTEVAVRSFNICLQWAEENNIPVEDILTLQKIKESKKNLKYLISLKKNT